jgi:hypothetical protein
VVVAGYGAPTTGFAAQCWITFARLIRCCGMPGGFRSSAMP